MKIGVTYLNNIIIGFVYLTNTRIKKKDEFSGRKIFIADLPIRVHIITPRI